VQRFEVYSSVAARQVALCVGQAACWQAMLQ
jgi:hypothetical protein